MRLPREPMAPIFSETIPQGSDWGYQLKWDGVRILAVVDQGDIRLYSRKLLRKDNVYPEVVRSLASLKQKRCLLDGEVVAFDPAENRPVFQKVLQRERSGTAGSSDAAISYVLFDLLQEGDEDLRDRPYRERHERLKQLFPGEPSPSLFVTDLFSDGEALWRWVETNGWEGMVSKRLASPYREGKRHQDWFKKKTAVVSDVQIVGVVIREGRVASLVMVRDGQFYGRVSLGLNERSKQIIRQYAVSQLAPDSPFRTMPAELKGEQVLWLAKPFVCRVRGLEVTSAGLLRHPKLEAIDLTRLAVAD